MPDNMRDLTPGAQETYTPYDAMVVFAKGLWFSNGAFGSKTICLWDTLTVVSVRHSVSPLSAFVSALLCCSASRRSTSLVSQSLLVDPYAASCLAETKAQPANNSGGEKDRSLPRK
jgi:hypothetical protein